MQHEIDNEAGHQCSQQEQHDAQHPQTRILGKTVILNEFASLKMINDERYAKYHYDEQETERREIVAEDIWHCSASKVKTEWNTPFSCALIYAFFLFHEITCKIGQINR